MTDEQKAKEIEETVEEMVKIGNDYCKSFIHECTPDSVCCLRCFATAICAAGYRKQSDTVKEFEEKLLLVVDKRIDTLEQVIQSAIQWGIPVSDSLMQTAKDDISVCNFWKTTINEVAASFGGEDNDANT